MTYLDFHLVFIAGPTVALAALALRARPILGTRTPLALFGVAPLALVYTARWDQYLIANRVWWYGEDRVLGSWLGVPYEEYAFMVLQPVLTGALLLTLLARRGEPRRPAPTGTGTRQAVLVALGLLGLGLGVGVPALRAGGRWTYLGLVVAWALPMLAALLGAAWTGLRAFRREALLAWTLSTLYLCVADRVAIASGVWAISPERSTGWMIGGLPLEEVLFFGVTNGLVVAGAMLFLAPGLPEPRATRA